MNKYRNKKVVVDGIKFDSQKEAKRYRELILLERAGQIRSLKLQPRFKLEILGVKIKYDSGRQVQYVADFMYTTADHRHVIEDCKGFRTPLYKLKRAIMQAMGHRIIET